MVDRQFILGFIKIHILYHASKAPIFGAEIAEELKRRRYHISPGTLYPTLRRLEEEGKLEMAFELWDFLKDNDSSDVIAPREFLRLKAKLQEGQDASS